MSCFCEAGSAMLFFLVVVVVVVCIVIPNKIALRHLASSIIASSLEDFSMLLPFD